MTTASHINEGVIYSQWRAYECWS